MKRNILTSIFLLFFSIYFVVSQESYTSEQIKDLLSGREYSYKSVEGLDLKVSEDDFIMFEDSFFAHMEEIDLCWKLQSMGYEVWVDPNALVYHKNALTLPMYSHKKYYFRKYYLQIDF